jgi:hypothetical protein
VLTISSYDLGMNPLFEDRAEEFILYDPCLDARYIPKKPDRIVGINGTRALRRILDNLEDIRGIRSTPFADTSNDPLLFPFLVLEAKREKDSPGFEQIKEQTAFPIWQLLLLQQRLRDRASATTSDAAPLVWFLASRGDYWRIYGCYITDELPPAYVSTIQLLLPSTRGSTASCQIGERYSS